MAFARQAISDLEARDVLESGGMARCHSLHYLQMAAEKVCKAHLHFSGQTVKESHAVVRKHLVSVAREMGPETSLSGNRLKRLKSLAAEIDMLAPALRADGSRQDNAEYPWSNALDEVIAPVDYEFSSIDDRQISDLVKLLRSAAMEYTS